MTHTDLHQPQPTATGGSGLLKVQEVADRLSVSRDHAYDLVNRGVFRKHYIGTGRRYYRVAEADVAAYIEGLSAEPSDDGP